MNYYYYKLWTEGHIRQSVGDISVDIINNNILMLMKTNYSPKCPQQEKQYEKRKQLDLKLKKKF